MPSRTNKSVLAIMLCGMLVGCSSRAFFQDNALTPAFNLYNRNVIVAAPTAFGNFVCGAPFFLLAGGVIDPVVQKISSNRNSETYTALINGIYMVPATLCGAATGLAFVPFSYICPENAWDYDFKRSRNVSWRCEKKEPGFEVAWDIGPKDSVVEQDIVVTRNRTYRLEIVFRSIYGRMSREDQKQAFKFTGDGTYQYVTKESADTDRPIVMPEYSEEEQEFLKNGGYFVAGDYFETHPVPANARLHTPPAGTIRCSTKSGAGVIVPVRIRLEQIHDDVIATVQTDEVIDTENIAGSWESGINRRIITIHLKPGHYRLRAMTLRESMRPPDLQTYLRGVKEIPQR